MAFLFEVLVNSCASGLGMHMLDWCLFSLQALVAFIGDCPDTAMLEDVLIAVLDLLRAVAPGRLPLLVRGGGACLFATLLSREQPALRILGLHLLAHFVPYIQTGSPPFSDCQLAPSANVNIAGSVAFVNTL